MKLEDFAGNVETDAAQAVTFLRRWYREDDLVTMIGVRKKQPDQPHLLANTIPASELWGSLESDPTIIDGLVRDEDSLWNLYVQMNPVIEPVSNNFLRGGDDNVKCFRGAWVDLDVKPSSFGSEEEILQFLRDLAVWPTMIARTGSGGVHAYWRLTEDRTPAEGRDLVRGWWSYLSEEAAKRGAQVDKLVDIARMMRVPGTVRWPKPDEALPPMQVQLIYAGGEDVSSERLQEVSAGASQRRYERIQSTIAGDRQRKWDRKSLDIQLDGSWNTLRTIANIDNEFNSIVTWDEILAPSGWTYLRTDHSERREWARPGRGDKSATTDWPDSPDVMSLLSSSEDTGLFDLKEAEIPLTKYRVALRLWFKDDETQMVKWTLQRMMEDASGG